MFNRSVLCAIVCMHVCVCYVLSVLRMHACAYMLTCVHACMLAHASGAYVYVRACVRACVRVCVRACVGACVRACVGAVLMCVWNEYVRVRVFTCMCMHICIHLHVCVVCAYVTDLFVNAVQVMFTVLGLGICVYSVLHLLIMLCPASLVLIQSHQYVLSHLYVSGHTSFSFPTCTYLLIPVALLYCL